jgi:SulP family sulfate permease
MAYAELAGMPPVHGLYAAALPPLAAALFASSPYLQTGPTALTSLLTLGALSSLATPASDDYVALAAVLALVVGVVRVVIGRLRAGAVSYLMSMPVLRGFTAAAAVLIFASQVPAALGVASEAETVLARAGDAFIRFGEWDPAALGLAAATIALLLGGRKVHPVFPGVLIAVGGGIVFGAHTGYAGRVVGDVPSVLFPPFSIDLPWGSLPSLLVSGGIIALVGFAEAASVSQTYAEQTRTTWDPNAEFVSQGAANLAAGLFGGFPVGGSFGRSALNRHAGAVTRMSGAVTGLVALAFLPFAWVISDLPVAILGGIVIGAVLKLLDPRPLVRLLSESRGQAGVAYGTFALTLLLAPHIEYAVIAGIALALAIHAWRETTCEVDAEVRGRVLHLMPRGVVWFASATGFRRRMAELIAEHREIDAVVIELSRLGRVDLTGAHMLRDVADTAKEAGVAVSFLGGPKRAQTLLARVCENVPHETTSVPPEEP